MSPPNNTTAFDVENHCNDSIRDGDQHEQQQQRKQQSDWEGPPAQGLYDPINEHEACGVGFIVAIDGKRSHKVHYPILFIRRFQFSKMWDISVACSHTFSLKRLKIL